MTEGDTERGGRTGEDCGGGSAGLGWSSPVRDSGGAAGEADGITAEEEVAEVLCPILLNTAPQDPSEGRNTWAPLSFLGMTV
jgi:hypothetical protein